MTVPSQTYQAYLLRLWRPNEAVPWRATLVQAEGGEQYHFADIDQAWIYLSQCLTDKPTSTDTKKSHHFPQPTQEHTP